MNCEDVALQLSAFLDGELDLSRSAEIDEHLRCCAECAALAQGLRELDEVLNTEFESEREATAHVAERTIRLLPAQVGGDDSPSVAGRDRPVKPGDHTSGPHWPDLRRLAWSAGIALLSAAAGFLLAASMYQGGSENDRGGGHELAERAHAPAEWFGFVNQATGQLQVADIASQEFADLEMHLFDVGKKLRTRDHKSELLTSGGAAFRLDCNSEFAVQSADMAELFSGRLMCYSPDSNAAAVLSCGTTIDVSKGSYDLRYVGEQEAELIVLDGDVRVTGRDGKSKIEPGKKIRLAGGKVIKSDDVANPLIETRWIHDLIRQKSPGDAELTKRVDALWASIGYSKVQHLYEDELRMLGPGCVRPLLSFLLSERREYQSDRRRALAARLVADLADYQSINQLVALLADDDTEIGFQAARGLQRITGETRVVTPAQWKAEDDDQRAAAVKAWEEWLTRREIKSNTI